jgi:hypothetical protein
VSKSTWSGQSLQLSFRLADAQQLTGEYIRIYQYHRETTQETAWGATCLIKYEVCRPKAIDDEGPNGRRPSFNIFFHVHTRKKWRRSFFQRPTTLKREVDFMTIVHIHLQCVLVGWWCDCCVRECVVYRFRLFQEEKEATAAVMAYITQWASSRVDGHQLRADRLTHNIRRLTRSLSQIYIYSHIVQCKGEITLYPVYKYKNSTPRPTFAVLVFQSIDLYAKARSQWDWFNHTCSCGRVGELKKQRKQRSFLIQLVL